MQVIKDWILVIVVAIIVGLEMIVMAVGTGIPSSRIIANAILVNEHRKKASNGVFKQLSSY